MYLVVCLYVVGEVVPGDGLDVLGRAQDGSAQGGALPHYCTVTVLTQSELCTVTVLFKSQYCVVKLLYSHSTIPVTVLYCYSTNTVKYQHSHSTNTVTVE